MWTNSMRRDLRGLLGDLLPADEAWFIRHTPFVINTPSPFGSCHKPLVDWKNNFSSVLPCYAQMVDVGCIEAKYGLLWTGLRAPETHCSLCTARSKRRKRRQMQTSFARLLHGFLLLKTFSTDQQVLHGKLMIVSCRGKVSGVVACRVNVRMK